MSLLDDAMNKCRCKISYVTDVLASPFKSKILAEMGFGWVRYGAFVVYLLENYAGRRSEIEATEVAQIGYANRNKVELREH